MQESFQKHKRRFLQNVGRVYNTSDLVGFIVSIRSVPPAENAWASVLFHGVQGVRQVEECGQPQRRETEKGPFDGRLP